MNRTAIAKRVVGALLLCALAVAAFFVLRIPIHWVSDVFDNASRNALAVVGVKATAEAAGDFMFFALVALVIVFQRRPGK